MSTYLKISMHDIVHVTMVDRLENLLNAMGGIGLGIIFACHNVLEQFAAGDQIEYQIVIALLLDAVVQTNCLEKFG